MSAYWKSWGETLKEGAKTTMAATKEKMQTLKETTQERMGSISVATKQRMNELKDQMSSGQQFVVNNKSYKSKRLLGEGGFGFVFLVTTNGIDQWALKQLNIGSKEQVQTVKDEIAVMSAVSGHPNIVKMLDSSLVSNPRTGKAEAFIIMEFCENSLVDVMNSRMRTKFAENEVLKIFEDVCKGVECLHSRNPPISHRDIKVENVLLSVNVFKLCDFGSCTIKTYSPTNDRERSVAEEDIQKNTTMEYRAPEMLDLYRGQTINSKVDIWALGVLLFKICYFQDAFEPGSSLGILNVRYDIPEDNKFSTGIIKTIKSILVADPTSRPDIQTILKAITIIKGSNYQQPNFQEIVVQPAPSEPMSPSISEKPIQTTFETPASPEIYHRKLGQLAKQTWISVPTTTVNSNTSSWEGTRNKRRPETTAYFSFVELLPNKENLLGALSAVSWTHTVLFSGLPGSLEEGTRHSPYFEKLRDQWNELRISMHDQNQMDVAAFLVQYCSYVISKLKFHSIHSEFEGNFSLDLYLKLEDSNISFVVVKAVISDLIELARRTSGLFSSLIAAEQPGIDSEILELLAVGTLSIAQEAATLRTILLFLLTKMTDMFGTCDAEFLQVYDSFSKDFSSFYARLITSVHKDRVSELVPKPIEAKVVGLQEVDYPVSFSLAPSQSTYLNSLIAKLALQSPSPQPVHVSIKSSTPTAAITTSNNTSNNLFFDAQFDASFSSPVVITSSSSTTQQQPSTDFFSDSNSKTTVTTTDFFSDASFAPSTTTSSTSTSTTSTTNQSNGNTSKSFMDDPFDFSSFSTTQTSAVPTTQAPAPIQQQPQKNEFAVNSKLFDMLENPKKK